jgi:hypothetical protein
MCMCELDDQTTIAASLFPAEIRHGKKVPASLLFNSGFCDALPVRKSFKVLCLALLIVGCASPSRRLEVSAVRQITPGVTTTADVEKLLGKPNETVTGSNGKSVARYFFREFRASNDGRAYERREHPGDILFRTLSLRYGPAGALNKSCMTKA